jgi:hypothetical protein
MQPAPAPRLLLKPTGGRAARAWIRDPGIWIRAPGGRKPAKTGPGSARRDAPGTHQGCTRYAPGAAKQGQNSSKSSCSTSKTGYFTASAGLETGQGPFRYRVKTTGKQKKADFRGLWPGVLAAQARAMFLTNIHVKFDIKVI